MTLTQIFKDIADAIRSKGISGTMKPGEMPEKIAGIKDASTMPRVKRVEAIPANIRSLSQSGTTLLTVESWCDGLYDSAGELQSGDCIAERGAITMRSNIPLSRFGDAVAEGVAKGMTFTSEEGYMVEGTAELGNKTYTFDVSTENTYNNLDRACYQTLSGTVFKTTEFFLTATPKKIETISNVLMVYRGVANNMHPSIYLYDKSGMEVGTISINAGESDMTLHPTAGGWMGISLVAIEANFPSCTHIKLGALPD